MKAKCPNPIQLRNGIVVPCGVCEICRAAARLEWQYRLRIHLKFCNDMPMFITLTYGPANLPFSDFGLPTVNRSDVSSFIKAYKRKYRLSNESFQYFGCAEYGDMFSRPHYHLLLFGDDVLCRLFMEDSQKAQARISSVWSNGFVHVGIAGFDGMAYVTKYVLKQNPEDYNGLQSRPFTISSKGLGMNFLKTEEAAIIRQKLEILTSCRDQIYSNMPDYSFHSLSSIDRAISYLDKFVPRFTTVLDDGTKVFLPRAIRKKLVGTFEHFKDNPLWLYNSLNQYRDSIEYYRKYGDYDAAHRLTYAMECSSAALDRINKTRCIMQNKKLAKKL